MPRRLQVLVCRGPDCGGQRDSHRVFEAMRHELDAPSRQAELYTLDVDVELDTYSCFGRCRQGPNVLVTEIKPSDNLKMLRLMPTALGGAMWTGVKPEAVGELLTASLKRLRPA